MLREISAGGVVIRKRGGAWWMAAIEPPSSGPAISPPAAAGTTSSEIKPTKTKRSIARSKPILALPKGLVDPGEKPLETALREVREETGVVAEFITKLGDIKYVYVRTWGDGQRVFKIVTFYLLLYQSGRIDDVSAEMRIEVARARWVGLDDAPMLLAYRGEKQMARKALEYVTAHAELPPA